MSFPITLKSIKRLFFAEVLSMLSEIFSIIVVCFSIVAFHTDADLENVSGWYALLLIFSMTFILVARIACYVFYLISLRRASAEDENFKVAFYSAVISLFLAIPSSIVTSNKEATSIAELLIILTVLLTEVYVLEGIRRLCVRLGHKEMDRQGAVIYVIITTIFVFQTCLSVFILVLGGTTATIGASWLGLLGSVLSIIESVLFLFYYVKAIRIFSKE